jgi:hypothetical protein
VNEVELVAEPAAVETRIGPLVARFGTVALTCVGERIVKLADLPLKLTDRVPASPVPVIVTADPIEPDVGEKLEIVGSTPKLLELVAVPFGVVTLIGPVTAAAGTVALIEPAETRLNTALVPLNLTAVAPVKLVPEIVTVFPTVLLPGLNPEIVGAGVGAAWAARSAQPLIALLHSCWT